MNSNQPISNTVSDNSNINLERYPIPNNFQYAEHNPYYNNTVNKNTTSFLNFFPAREWLYIITVFFIFIISFFPAHSTETFLNNIGNSRTNLPYIAYNMWGMSESSASIANFNIVLWKIPILEILLPLAAATLIVIRRIAKSNDITIGSLSVDQFASVAASVSFVSIFTKILTISNSSSSKNSILGYREYVEPGLSLLVILSGFLVVISIMVMQIQFLNKDIISRSESLAHPLACNINFNKNKTTQNLLDTQTVMLKNNTYNIPHNLDKTPDSLTPESNDTQTPSKAFWFAVPETRTIYSEEQNIAIFTINPGIWHLALAEYPDYFIVRNINGISGKLTDIKNIERA